jgi:soluble lytic murein transglycosylase
VIAATLALLACSGLPAGRTAPARPALAAGAAASPPTDRATVRHVFIDAMLRVQAASAQAPADSRALQHYVLYDYLVAARLRLALQSAPGAALDARIDAFLQAHMGEPVSHDLRREWLASLADRQRWDWFLPRAAQNHLSDPLLICDRLSGRLATGDTATLAADALLRWQRPIEQPPECAGVFAWLRQQNLLSPALTAARMRAALAAGDVPLAREFAADVSSDQLPPLLQWQYLLQSPRPTLAQLAAHPDAPVDSQALQGGFARLSLRDSAAAAMLLPSLLARADMTAAVSQSLQRDAALGLAYDHSPAAVPAFLALSTSAAAQSPQANDTRLLEWRVRAALWAGDYAQALSWIEHMPEALAAQPRWRYWRARTTEATQGAEAAAPLYAGIAGLRDYYGYLAADRLHRPYDLNAHATPDDPDLQRMLGGEPGLVRAHELLACGMYDDAVAEWAAALADAAPAVRVQAAHLAARWGWYAQSIASLAQAGEWDDVRLRYPSPYADLIATASATLRLPADWILAVMRQESLFRPDAISRADARGLMQLELPTAEGVAQRWHLPPPDAASLFTPQVAVALGAAHLRELLDRYDGRIAMALAAYNAGSEPLARWLPDRAMDADVWIENIPYDETRSYVEAILEHIVAYGWTRGGAPPQLAALLPPIGPAAAPTPALTPALGGVLRGAGRPLPALSAP